MAKKHWIYVKRGLSESAKHRAAMGECIWLFLHIIDRADWETGIAYDWKDREEAADMGMQVDTLRAQRQKLEKLDYIRCTQKQHGQDITIMEWINPRDYSAGVVNPRCQGMAEPLPSEGGIQGGAEPLPSNFQGGSQGGSQVPGQTPTPTLDSESDSESLGGSGLSEKEIEQANKKVDAIIAAGSNPKNYANREKIPENHRHYCDLYVSLCGKDPEGHWNQVPTKRVIVDWIVTFEEWQQENLKPEHIQAAFQYATAPETSFLVGRPGALTKTAVAMKTKPVSRSNQPAVDRSAVDRTKQEIEKKNTGAFVSRPENLPAPSIVRARMQELTKSRSNKNALSS